MIEVGEPLEGVRLKVIWGTILKFLSFPVNFITTIVLAKNLNLEIFGFYNLVTNLHGVFSFIVGAGILHAISRFIPELVQLNRFREGINLTLILFALRFLIVSLVSIVGLIFAQPLFRYFNLPIDADQYALLVISILWLPRIIDPIGPQFRTALADYKQLAIHDLVKSLVLCLGAVCFSYSNQSYFWLLILLLSVELVSALVFTIQFSHSFFAHRLVGKDTSGLIPSSISLKRVFRYSFHTTLYGFGALALGTSVDSLIVARFFGIEEVGIYAFAFWLVLSVHTVNPTIFLKSLFLNVTNRIYTLSKSIDSLSRCAELAVRSGLFWAFPSLGFLYIYGDRIIYEFFNKNLIQSADLFPYFCLMCVSRSFSLGLFAVVSALEKTKYLVLFNLVGLANIALGIMFARYIGLAGVAIATAICELTWTGGMYLLLSKRDKISLNFFNRKVLLVFFNSSASLLVASLAGTFSAGIPGLIIAGIALSLTYWFLTKLFSPFTKEEKSFMTKELRIPKWCF